MRGFVSPGPSDPEPLMSYADIMTTVTNWAAKNDRRLFLSEFGVDKNDPGSPAALDKLLEYLNNNNNVWIGWTIWNLKEYSVTKYDDDEHFDYTMDGPAMAWYARYLISNIVNT